MIKLGIVGCLGKMGTMNANEAVKDGGFVISGALEYKGHKDIGKKFGSVIGIDSLETAVTDDADLFLKNVDTIIDFTGVESSLSLLEKASILGKKYVLGTTGFSEEQRAMIKEYSSSCPVVFSSNMSLGVNVLFALTQEAAKMLGKYGYDIEIIEAHHNAKKDSPSGTAITLAEKIADVLSLDLKKKIRHGREGMVGARTENEIGMHAIRAGDIVGEHTVMFAKTGERIELTHRAQSRINFAIGAISAAKWLENKQPGLYDMFDVIGLKK